MAETLDDAFIDELRDTDGAAVFASLDQEPCGKHSNGIEDISEAGKPVVQEDFDARRR